VEPSDLALELAAADGEPAVARRSGWILLARLTISVGMLGVLVWRLPHFEASDLLPDWTWETALFLLGAAALTLVGIVLSTIRWRAVLHALGQDAPLRHLLSYNLAGLFVSNVLPTTIGGDVLRVSRLSRENGETAESFASVVLERLTGWLVLPVLTFAGFIVNPGLRHLGTATQVAVSLAAGTLVALLLLLAAVANQRFGARVNGSSGWRKFAAAVHLGIERLRHHPAAAANVLLTGFAYQLVLVLAALLAAKAVGMDAGVGPTALLAFFPAVLIAQVLPVSISGLGVREASFILFLHPLGIPDAQAIALGLLLYLLNVAVSLLGAPAFAVGGKRLPARALAA